VTTRRIDQVIPSLASRDAIGGHVVQLRDLLRSRGFASDIYYGNATPDRLDHGYPIERIGDRPSAGRVLLYQLSIGSGVADIFRDRPERKFVNYHNITPAGLLEDWIPAVGDEVRLGRAQMETLAPLIEFAVADSRYNEEELRALGYRSTLTVPLLLDLEGFAGRPDPVLAARLASERADGGTSFLFVGKVSPHKGQHDLVKALAAYRRLYDPRARLRLVGGAISDNYRVALERFIDELGLSDAVEIAGSVTHEELIAYYGAADAFVCLSDHEGFCVPLLEAMYHRVPIVTWEFTAVPETVGAAGLVLADKRPARVAAAIHRVVGDAELRAALAAAQSERVAAFALPSVQERFASALEEAYAAGPGSDP
jgi:glycosyltransferase involved in cell wall biosynthesis